MPSIRQSKHFTWIIHLLLLFQTLIWIRYFYCGASLVAQMVKNLPAMQETLVWSLGWKDPLEKRMSTHSNVLVWRIPWTEEPGGLQFMRSQRAGHNWVTHTHTHPLYHHLTKMKKLELWTANPLAWSEHQESGRAGDWDPDLLCFSHQAEVAPLQGVRGGCQQLLVGFLTFQLELGKIF